MFVTHRLVALVYMEEELEDNEKRFFKIKNASTSEIIILEKTLPD